MSNKQAIMTVYWFMYPKHYPFFREWMLKELWKPSIMVLRRMPK